MYMHILPHVFPVILKNLSAQCVNLVEYGISLVRTSEQLSCIGSFRSMHKSIVELYRIIQKYAQVNS